MSVASTRCKLVGPLRAADASPAQLRVGFEFRLIPQPVRVADIVWSPNRPTSQ